MGIERSPAMWYLRIETMRLRGFRKLSMACAAGLALIVIATVISKAAAAGPTVTVYKSPT